MDDANRVKLEQLGLSPAEAQVYLAILHHGPLAVAAIAHGTGIKRPSVYPTLSSLVDKGLVESGAGYGSKFAVVAPDQALPALVVRQKQTISERERIADELGLTLAPLTANAESALDASVQVLRTPQVIVERSDRLQQEAQGQVEFFNKAPILNPQGNPAQSQAQKRGVHYRAVYERTLIDDPKIKPYLASWVAGGEEARVYDGELPYKLVIADSESVLLTLVRMGGQTSALLVRHTPFAKSMSILFDSFWNQSQPLVVDGAKTRRSARKNTRTPKQSASLRRASGGKGRDTARARV